MPALLQEGRPSIAFDPPKPALPGVEVDEAARQEFQTQLENGSLRMRYNPDQSVTFLKRHRMDGINSRTVNYDVVDLDSGYAGHGFGTQLSPGMVSVLREVQTNIQALLAEDPTPNKFITPDIRDSYNLARGHRDPKENNAEEKRRFGIIRLNFNKGEPQFKIKRSGENGKDEFATVNVIEGIIEPTPSHPARQPLPQAWWELYQEEALATASIVKRDQPTPIFEAKKQPPNIL